MITIRCYCRASRKPDRFSGLYSCTFLPDWSTQWTAASWSLNDNLYPAYRSSFSAMTLNEPNPPDSIVRGSQKDHSERTSLPDRSSNETVTRIPRRRDRTCSGFVRHDHVVAVPRRHGLDATMSVRSRSPVGAGRRADGASTGIVGGRLGPIEWRGSDWPRGAAPLRAFARSKTSGRQRR